MVACATNTHWKWTKQGSILQLNASFCGAIQILFHWLVITVTIIFCRCSRVGSGFPRFFLKWRRRPCYLPHRVMSVSQSPCRTVAHKTLISLCLSRTGVRERGFQKFVAGLIYDMSSSDTLLWANTKCALWGGQRVAAMPIKGLTARGNTTFQHDRELFGSCLAFCVCCQLRCKNCQAIYF